MSEKNLPKKYKLELLRAKIVNARALSWDVKKSLLYSDEYDTVKYDFNYLTEELSGAIILIESLLSAKEEEESE